MHRYVYRQKYEVQFVVNVQALLQIEKKASESASAMQSNLL